MVEQLDKESLRAACAALRTVIASRARGNPETLHALLRALTGVEHAALNAPQNQGWLQKRKIELRNTLHAFTGADEVQVLYKNIEAILQRDPPLRQSINATLWLPRGRF
jgi:hypothetical protein